MTTIAQPETAGQPIASRPVKTPVVSVVATTPETVLADVERAMRLAGAEQVLSRDLETLLKINISWQHWYPGCSTDARGSWKEPSAPCTTWATQDLIAAHNGTVVVDSFEGEVNNKPQAGAGQIQPSHRAPGHAAGAVGALRSPRPRCWSSTTSIPKGIEIPQIFAGKNIVHLPTMKTHVFTTMTGAMKNAFGGLLHRKRHWTHSVIHETLVDLLAIQQEIHPGIFAVTDGTFAGDGPGPRAMRWHIKNRIVAGADQVAVDAVVASMMGFDPLSMQFIRLAHERGLGMGDMRDIDVVGDEPDISRVNWNFADNREHLRQPRPETHLLGPPQTLGKRPPPLPHRRLGLHRQQPLPQRVLAEHHRQIQNQKSPQNRMGPAVGGVLVPKNLLPTADDARAWQCISPG